ncbi:MAG: DUF1365 domain-containing protein [Acidobacteriota bacterium]
MTSPPEELPGAPKSAVYIGRVMHHRMAPREHRFSYPAAMLYLNLDEVPEIFDRARFWSARRFAPGWFRRADYFGEPQRDLATCLRELVEERTEHRPEGSIGLLTHARTWGHCFNPVSFYYLFDNPTERDPDEPRAIVAEVNNTPWNERYAYVLDGTSAHSSEPGAGRDRSLTFTLAKDFHVSPFMAMDMDYRWRFSPPGKHLRVWMESFREGEKMFNASLSLERRPLALDRYLFRFPAMTLRGVYWIYREALRLKRKGVPFFPHPKTQHPKTETAAASPARTDRP